MPSETFYCPHCNRQLTKSAQAYVLGEAIANKTHFIAFGEKPTVVTCPGCGGRIDAMKMVEGAYDVDPVTAKYSGLYALGIFGMPFLCRFVFHWSWVVSILAGLFLGALAAQLIIEILKSTGNKK